MIQEESMKDNTAAVHCQVPVEVASFLLNEKRTEIAKIELKQRVSVVLIPNKTLETPHYKLERLKHDDPRLDGIEASYKLADEAEEQTRITRRSQEPTNKQTPVIKGVLPDAPAPVAEPRPQASAAQPARGQGSRSAGQQPRAAAPAPVQPPVQPPFAAAPEQGFFAWLKSLFGFGPAPTPAPAPVVQPAPQPEETARGEGRREGRSGERGRRGGRGEGSRDSAAAGSNGSQGEGRGRRGEGRNGAGNSASNGTGNGERSTEAREPRGSRGGRDRGERSDLAQQGEGAGESRREPREGRGSRERGERTERGDRAERAQPSAGAMADRADSFDGADSGAPQPRGERTPRSGERDGERSGEQRRGRRGERAPRTIDADAPPPATSQEFADTTPVAALPDLDLSLPAGDPSVGTDGGDTGEQRRERRSRDRYGRDRRDRAPRAADGQADASDSEGQPPATPLLDVDLTAAGTAPQGAEQPARRSYFASAAPETAAEPQAVAAPSPAPIAAAAMELPAAPALQAQAAPARMVDAEPSPAAPAAATAAAAAPPPAPVAPAATPASTSSAAQPGTALPRVEAFELPVEALAEMARASGLQWVNSDAAKIAAAQAAIAAEPRPVHEPRERPPVVALDEGPLVLVETRRDLRELRLPFEQTATP